MVVIRYALNSDKILKIENKYVLNDWYKNNTFLGCFHAVMGGRKIRFSNFLLG